MKKEFIFLIVFLFSIFMMLASCVKKSVTNISDNVRYQPTFSIPITTASFSINDYFENIDTVIPGYPDYVYYNDSLLPNYSKIITFNEGVQYDFSSLGSWINQLSYAMFRLNVDNGFPTEAVLQVYFADITQSPFDSLFTDGPLIIPPAEINANGKVTSSNRGQYDVELNNRQLNELGAVNYLIVKGGVYTTRQDIDTVKFYPGYRISVQIGLRAGLDVQTGNK